MESAARYATRSVVDGGELRAGRVAEKTFGVDGTVGGVYVAVRVGEDIVEASVFGELWVWCCGRRG